MVLGSGNEPIAEFGRRIGPWDASTTHSLALLIASKCVEDEQRRMFAIIVSYLVRRAVCGLTAKNYNKVFLQQLKKLGDDKVNAAALTEGLGSLEGEASRWPRDDEFRKSWIEAAMYAGRLTSSQVKAILAELENAMRSTRTEEPFAAGLENLDVDHILPDSWFEHWPLPDGSKAEANEAYASLLASYSDQPVSDRHAAIRRRENAKTRLGNLTLLHYGVNRSSQHREFTKKRELLFAESNLHLNRSLMRLDAWNEDAIDARGRALFDIAKTIWRGPA